MVNRNRLIKIKKINLRYEADDMTLAGLLKLCGNDETAYIEIDYDYDESTPYLCWEVLETDEELIKRITLEEKEEELKRKKAETLRNRELKELARLKKKYEEQGYE